MYHMPQSRPIERKLTTILAADAANYSGRMRRDEEGTVRALRAAREVIDSGITRAHGRIANTSGDGLIAEFPSVIDAVRCAIDIQQTLNGREDLLPFRLGVHLDNVIIEGEDLLGDGVNLAARLQEMAEIGGVLVSQQVRDHVRDKIRGAELRPLGPAAPKHLDEVGLYAVVAPGLVAPRLLDNLGPKVPRPTLKPDPAPEPKAVSQMPSHAIEMRKNYVKTRKFIWVGIAGLAGVDLITGAPFLDTAVPTVGLKRRAFNLTHIRLHGSSSSIRLV
ncbi:adenylate/guanylate cyclase domain-containing protein [Tateyamaria sp.]|uniref:adenylate/guanylate cyclase domain-containing protein n=1 Tax=Tateyamaria sp. TaxID=1929288 RepID=UPI003B2253F4